METFINARIVSYSSTTWFDQEGCLSIPGIFGEVERPWEITIEYLDRNFVPRTRIFKGLTARMV